MNYTDADFLAYNPFEGERDVRIRARVVRVVTTRKPQKCFSTDGKMHGMLPGTRARFESAIVDGEWGSYYTCIACMEAWMRAEKIRPIDRSAKTK